MVIDLLLFDTVVLVDSGFIPPPADISTPSGPIDQPWLLLASIAMFAISFFLLHQAVGFQRWVTSKDEAAPNPQAGLGMSWALALAMIFFSVLYWLDRHPPDLFYTGTEAFRWVISNRPSELAIGPLLGSVVPAAIAIFKFVTAGFIMRSAGQEVPPLSRSPIAALAGAIFTLISLAASIATLIMFFFWRP